jgi:carboxylate-amine ligase
MPSCAAAVELTERARGVLPALLALSSSSPFWDGFDTGFASFRHRLLAMTPNYGSPPRMASPADLERVMSAGRRAGILESYRDVHWDIRPRPDFGTLELRVFDAQPTLSSSLSLAALAHSLFVALLRDDTALDEYLIPPLPSWMERENAFRASRFGLDAQLFVDESGETRGAREVLAGVLSALAPTAVELGEGAELEGAIDLLLEGSWADRARALLARYGSFSRVTAALADALDEDLVEGIRVHPHVYTRDAHR